MIVDDRLDTVLRTHAAGQAGINTQFRQLADLLGRTPDAGWGPGHSAALDRIDALHTALGDAAAAVLLRLCVLRSARLVAHLACKGGRTAIAAIQGARLADPVWLALIPGLPVQARGVLRHRRDLGEPVMALLARLGIDDFVLPEPDPKLEPDPEPAPAPVAVLVPLPRPTEPATDSVRRNDPVGTPPPPREGIGAIVRRIEAFRRTRDGEAQEQDDATTTADPAQTRLPFADEPGGESRLTRIDLAIDAGGTIVGADGADPAMLVGHTPFCAASPAATAMVDAATLRAVRARRPVASGRLVLDGAPRVAGAWRIDAVPLFDGEGGQFLGYRARLRRPALAGADAMPAAQARPGPGEGDVLRQLLHELRTPINAIQGFAELIQQQLFGPTPHQYRSLAASIAADAARMLAGFEDVERLVRLEQGALTLEPGETDLADLLPRMIAQLEPLSAPREIRLRWIVPPVPVMIGLAREDAETVLWRLVSTLVGAAAPGERLAIALQIAPDGATADLRLGLPAALAQRDDAALFAPEVGRGGIIPGSAMLGHGFALRLCHAEIHAAGGTMVRLGLGGGVAPDNGAMLGLTLPLVAPVTLDRNVAAS